jgi:hypothetical protein
MNILLFILLLNGLLLLLQPIIAQPVPGVLTRMATNTVTLAQKASGGLILPPRVPGGLTLPHLGPRSILPLGFKPPNIPNLIPATFKVQPSSVNPLSRTASVSESLSRTASVSESLSRTASTVPVSTVYVPESVSSSTVTIPASTVTIPASTVTIPASVSASTVTIPVSTVTVPAPEIPRYVRESIIVPESSTIILQRIDSGYSQKDEIIKHVNDIGKSVVSHLNDVYHTETNYKFDINNDGRIRPKGNNFINIKHKGHQIAHLTLYDKPTSVSGHKLSSIHLGVIDGSTHHHYYMVNVDSQDNIIWRKQFPHTPEFSDQVQTVANAISDYFIEKGLNVPK